MSIYLAQSPARRLVRKGWRLLLIILGLALAWHALQDVDWEEMRKLLAGIGPFAILTIATVNLLLLPMMAARWWLLLRTLDSPVSLLSLSCYRAAASAVSYLTPGPHFGGEPLAVFFLRHHHNISLPTATTSVAVDRLLELLASVIILALCLLNLAFADNHLFTAGRGPFIVFALAAMVVLLLSSLFAGRRPLSTTMALLSRLFNRFFPLHLRKTGSVVEIFVEGETMAESLFRNHRHKFLLLNLLSLVYWLGVFLEFWLMSFFLGFPLSLYQLTIVVLVARLAFFTPLPAGIGVLESALPWVTAALGLGSVAGLGLCLIIRLRDIFFNLAGLGLMMKYLTCASKVSIIKVDQMGSSDNDPLE